MMKLADRIAGYAYRYWQRHGMTEWPSVKQTRHALRLRNADIDGCDGDTFQLTGYNREHVTVGDLCVEASIPEVERAWCEYWLPFSAGCYCGSKHNE